MTSLHEIPLLQKLVLLQNRAFQPVHQPVPALMNQNLFPMFSVSGPFSHPQPLFANRILTVSSEPMGKHSCSARSLPLMPITTMNHTPSPLSAFLIQNPYLPRAQATASNHSESGTPRTLFPKLSSPSKKINRSIIQMPVVPRRKKISKTVKKVWFLPREKKNRKTAAQVVRAFKCTAPGCSKAYGSEPSLKVHLKTKHPDMIDDKFKDTSSMKTDELSN